MPRSTHIQLLQMRKTIFQKLIDKRISRTEAADLLGIHQGSVSRLKKKYLLLGDCALIGRKPGPRSCTPDNRTPEYIEQIVEDLGNKHLDLGPLPLSEKLEEDHGIKLHSTTVWRILKRRKVRYTTEYKRWRQDPKLYCLDTQGRELQLDACFPFGRSRKLVSFDAIDDCSRFVFGKAYHGEETAEAAIQFVSELIERVPFRIERIRVDNRYGKKLEEFCEKLGIEVHRNDAYAPEQNGKIERFHRTLKREFFWKYCRFEDDLDTINYRYSLWLKHYNYFRKHGGFGMDRATPAEKILKTWLHGFAHSCSQNGHN